MSDRTGRAMGSLDPVIYFENAAGHLLLPPVEIGTGLTIPKRLYEERYKHEGYQWCEAGTWSDVQRLQKRLVEQEQRLLDKQHQTVVGSRDRAAEKVNSDLRQRMASSSCSAYEREFLQLWLQLREDKRERFESEFKVRNMYLQAVEFDSNHKMEDRMR